MHPLIQLAIEATQSGDKNKAFELLRQILTANPNDVDAMLVLAGLTDQPERKRQILDRALRIDPIHKVAREELTKLDRLAMGNFLAETRPPITTKPFAAEPATISNSESPGQTADRPIERLVSSSAHPQPISPPQPVPGLRLDKPVVFRYPARGRIGYFVIAAIFGCLGLFWLVSQSDASALSLLCMGTLFGLAALSNQSSVTVSESGIRTTNLFSKAEIRWNEIASMQSNVWRKRLELTPNQGDALKISTQIDEYPMLVEILRQKRPDLFNAVSSSSAPKSVPVPGFDSSPSMYVNNSSPSAFAGIKTFNKNFFGQYGILLLMLPLCITSPLLIYFNGDWFAGIGIGLVGLFFMMMSLFSVNQIRLESNKLTAEAFFYQREFTAKQIREISMKTVRSRRGIATNFVNIQPMEGNAISMAGFPEGEEIIYGTLMDWWNTHRNQ